MTLSSVGLLDRLPRRVYVPCVHFVCSIVFASVCALLVFFLWYPWPFDVLSGGLGLFALLVVVDVVMGPTLSAIAASPRKPSSELGRDLFIIVVLQFAAFSYGMQTIVRARPVYLSYEIDRFRVVSAIDVDADGLSKALPEYRALPWTGPRIIAAVKPIDPDEQLKSIDLGFAGFDLSMIPANWRSYASEHDSAWRKARPVDILRSRYPAEVGDLAAIAAKAGQPESALRFLPVLSRRASWVAVLAPADARIVGYLPVEGFF